MADTRTRNIPESDESNQNTTAPDAARVGLQAESEQARSREQLMTTTRGPEVQWAFDRRATTVPVGFPTLEIATDKGLASTGEGGRDKATIPKVEAAPRTVKLEDGSYTRDAQGRVTEMVSADGSTKRNFKYGDPSNPNRVTSLTINDKTEFKYLGPVTTNGQPLKENGHEVNGYSVYQNGQLAGNWAGILDVDKKGGVYNVRSSGDSGAIRREGASGAISQEESEKRNHDGIWSGARKDSGEAPPPAPPTDADDTDSARPPRDARPPKNGAPADPAPTPRPPKDGNSTDGARPPRDTRPPKEGDSTDGARPPRDTRPPKEGDSSDARPPISRVGHSEGADPAAFNGRTIKLDDGTYTRDDKGRVTEMLSPDGKIKRNFKYEDPSNPDRVTALTINDKQTFKYLGPVTSNGTPLKEDGHEVNSYSIYDEKGNLQGNWAGILDVSKNGVYNVRTSGDQNPIRHEGASGKISDTDAEARDKDGIWPSKIQVEHKDGTKYTADFKGTKLDTIKESRTVDGKQQDITWQRQGEKFVSDEKPPRERKSMELRQDGSLKYEEKSGQAHVKYKDGSRDLIEGGVTRHYDTKNQVEKITQPNGDSRSFTYQDGKLSSITDLSKDGKSTWTRNGDEWTSGNRKEIRKDVAIKDDGAVEYTLANGNKVRETKDFSKVELDDKNRPVRTEFHSGSARTFQYDGDKLKSVTDTVKRGDKETSRTWQRQGDSDTFVDSADPKKERTISALPNGDGDYNYKGKDGKDRASRARELERQARGETVSGSESFQEAKEDLLEAARLKGIDTKRFGGYIDEFEKNGTKYGVKEEQLTKTLDNLRQTLAAERSPLYNQAQLKTAVETAMHNMARPMEIDQGAHPTCNVTTLEVYAAAKHPEQYSRMLKEIATTGKYKTNDGTTVTPPTNALKPGEDETAYNLDKPNVGQRNLASQIVQMTLINGLYESGGVTKYINGQNVNMSNTRYVMDKSYWQNMGNGVQQKVGEDRLADVNGRPTQGTDGGPEFTQGEIMGASKMMLGYEMPYVKAPVSMDGGQTWKYDLPSSERLMQMKRDNKFPVGVATIGGVHVQTIHDAMVDSRGQTWVLLDNQHAEKHDGWITLQDLHRTQQDRNYEAEPQIRRWQRPKN